jgi:hypothetical protein
MGFLSNLLSTLGLGRKASSGDRGVYYYVRCDRCKETIRFRVDPLWDLGTADGGGFVVTKQVMGEMRPGQKCFRTIEVTLTFDDRREETERSITGGTFVTAEDYEREHPATPETA